MALILDHLSDILPDTQVNTGLRKRLLLAITVGNFFEEMGLLLLKSGIVSLLSWASFRCVN